MAEVLNRNEVMHRAVRFARDWRGESRERAEAQTFWNEFLAVFGMTRRQVATYEWEAKRQSTGRRGWIDLLWPGYIAAEHKSRGHDLDEAIDQLRDYLPSIPPESLPRLVVVCDFQSFRIYDFDLNQEFAFELADLPANIDRMLFLAGHGTRNTAESEEDVNLKATALMAALHDSLRDSGYKGHPLRALLVRLMFVLFADDTEVWEKGLFHYVLTHKTREDGSDLGPALAHLFQVLDTPKEHRPTTLDADLDDFTYINGDLFAETLPIPSLTSVMRDLLIRACSFDWSKISPAIFGSMFQEVMSDVERRHLGAHYTTEQNILRTIRPLFLDELETQLAAASTRPALIRFRSLLGSLKFFDPACGCGNFLIVAYREIRRLELQCLVQLRDLEVRQHRRAAGQLTVEASIESTVRVGQFYGIELEEFPARIAETAMYLMDHLANQQLSAEFGQYYVRFPIRDTAHIHIANALRVDWNDVLRADECSYLLGNPPFSGQYTRSLEQTEDLRAVWGAGYNGYLDYVTAWYLKAIEYVEQRRTRIAFVSTNSISQGEPVSALWQPILDAGFGIDFAHRTFLWTSEARGSAGVHVVIIGLSYGDDGSLKAQFDYPVYGRGEPTLKMVRHLNPYLVEGPDVLVRPRTTPLASDLPSLRYGSKVADGGHLLVTSDQYDEVAADPRAAKYLRPFIGARELIHGQKKWCLWMQDLDASDLRASHVLRARVDAVREVRLRSSDREIREAAARPAHFLRNLQPETEYLAIPAHVGESRSYFPVGYYSPDVITGNHNFVAEDPDGYLFGLLSSAMFMSWMRTVSGRIRADLRFSKTLTWHNFPLPDVAGDVRARVGADARAVLEMRLAYTDSSLADLYDPVAMPAPLLTAHRRLDRTVDACFVGHRRALRSEADRQSVLFQRYQQLLAEREAGQPPGNA